eukprot:m.81827 g.81827  ORF g.81827 m.81827 type:complete len:405 (+) comp36264_c0_seq1:143-1357(+)
MSVKYFLPTLPIVIYLLLVGSVPSQTANITGRYLYVTVRSEGCNDQGRVGCGKVAMEVNGRTINLPFAGYNILSFSDKTGDQVARGNFDMRIAGNGQKMYNFVYSKVGHYGSIVLVAVGESGGTLDLAGEKALRLIGAVTPFNLKPRETWALIGYRHYNYKLRVKPWIRQAYSPRSEGPTILTERIPLKDICSNNKATCPGCRVPVKCDVDPCKGAICKGRHGAHCMAETCGYGEENCTPKFFLESRVINCHILRVRAYSAGCEDQGVTGCGIAKIEIWGSEYSYNRRGHNVVIVDPKTGRVEGRGSFDTFGDPKSGESFRRYLNRLSPHKIVIIATKGSADVHDHHAHTELSLLGAGSPLDAGRNGSWVLVSRKGCRPAWFRQAWNVAEQGPTEVVVDIPLVD